MDKQLITTFRPTLQYVAKVIVSKELFYLLVKYNYSSVEKIGAFWDNGSLLFGSLLPAILEGHAWASIEGERV